MNELIRVAADFQGFCESRRWRFCFIGGLALQDEDGADVVAEVRPTVPLRRRQLVRSRPEGACIGT